MGEKELADGVVQMKDLQTGAQSAIPVHEVVGEILTQRETM